MTSGSKFKYRYLIDFHGVCAGINRKRALQLLQLQSDLLKKPPNYILRKFFDENPYFKQIDDGTISYIEMLAIIAPALWRGELAAWISIWDSIWDQYEANDQVLDFLKLVGTQGGVFLIVTDNHRDFRGWIARHSQFSFLEPFLFCSGELGITKSDPSFFFHALKVIGCGPAGCAYVDDNEVNVSLANRLGICSVQYTIGDIVPFADLEPVKCARFLLDMRVGPDHG